MDHEDDMALDKLHIGCGSNILSGWLNVDFAPYSEEVKFLDATKVFDFRDGAFLAIFSEHMIEHLTYPDGLLMLSECFRVLKSGGKIRITTPNLKNVMGLYQNPELGIHADYIRWSIQNYVPHAITSAPGYFVNNFVRDWGHKFIYDPETLSLALVKSGFEKINASFSLSESDDPVLRNLEYVKRLPEGFLQLESMTLEATKP